MFWGRSRNWFYLLSVYRVHLLDYGLPKSPQGLLVHHCLLDKIRTWGQVQPLNWNWRFGSHLHNSDERQRVVQQWVRQDAAQIILTDSALQRWDCSTVPCW
jgi:hypothetical protein